MMMKPIAVIHWTDSNDVEHEKICYWHSQMESTMELLDKENLLSFICMCRPDVSLPLRPPRSHDRGV